MQKRRNPRERVRWLSAVLIVTAIAGASAAVRFWPVSLPPRAPRPLASRALPAIDPPVLPIPGRVRLEVADTVDLPSAPARPAAVPEPLRDVSTDPPSAVVAGDVAASGGVRLQPEHRTAPSAVPLLESRTLAVPLDAPVVTYHAEPVLVVAGDESHALMELPAVAVTRVVTVAGRGILTGVRATTAVFRAAF